MADGVFTAVASNKPHKATTELCAKMFPAISVVCGEREAEGIRRKPNPDMVLWAVKTLGCDVSECVYIGDSEVDIETAKNAGMDVISVLWGFRDRPILEKAGAEVFAETADALYEQVCG